ncbi:hypothetical protein DSO57_1008579 [Entomophthora muscae]|uniref:Uncharacterized protein n=1 Tax=Entomophthora muscae TaxID=34485 RepID=A0ACC2RLT7_9FUNG|nr:hypothetical protein DSO57_1008579 [Entomophthora muscae]
MLYVGITVNWQFFGQRKSWGKIAETPIQGAKFDKEFPPLLGENKNKFGENPDLGGCWTNLSSGQAPTTTAQTPATPSSTHPATCPPACLSPCQRPSQAPATHSLTCPAASVPAASPQPTCLLPGPQLAACHPPGSQGPPCNQS